MKLADFGWYHITVNRELNEPEQYQLRMENTQSIRSDVEALIVARDANVILAFKPRGHSEWKFNLRKSSDVMSYDDEYLKEAFKGIPWDHVPVSREYRGPEGDDKDKLFMNLDYLGLYIATEDMADKRSVRVCRQKGRFSGPVISDINGTGGVVGIAVDGGTVSVVSYKRIYEADVTASTYIDTCVPFPTIGTLSTLATVIAIRQIARIDKSTNEVKPMNEDRPVSVKLTSALEEGLTDALKEIYDTGTEHEGPLAVLLTIRDYTMMVGMAEVLRGMKYPSVGLSVRFPMTLSTILLYGANPDRMNYSDVTKAVDALQERIREDLTKDEGK